MRLSVKERDGYRMLLLGPEGWTEQAAERYLTDGCDGVGLGALTTGGSLTGLDFLRPLQQLRSVVLGATKVKDLAPLFDKVELEELSIGLNVRDLRGIGRLTNLMHLAVPFRKGIDEISGLPRLQTLSIEEWPKGADLHLLGMHPHLRQFWLSMKRTAEVSSEWFRSVPALEDLSFYFGRLTDIDGLAELNRLESLRFAATKVGRLDFTTATEHLHSLELDNSGDVASLRPLRGHRRMEQLSLIGSTRIVDGDLTPLLDMAGLRVFVIERDHPHYTPRTQELRRRFPAH